MGLLSKLSFLPGIFLNSRKEKIYFEVLFLIPNTALIVRKIPPWDQSG